MQRPPPWTGWHPGSRASPLECARRLHRQANAQAEARTGSSTPLTPLRVLRPSLRIGAAYPMESKSPGTRSVCHEPPAARDGDEAARLRAQEHVGEQEPGGRQDQEQDAETAGEDIDGPAAA